MALPARSLFLPVGLVMLVVLFGELMVMTEALPSAAGHEGPSHVTFLSREQWIQLRAMAKEVPCEEVVNGTSGKLASPNYPKDYPDNVACAWDVIVPEGNTISLRFTDFHVQPSQNCIADYVGVYDGENYFLYCGWQPPPEIRSQANIMGIVLVSDDQVHIGSRFQAEFQAVPAEDLCSESVTATVTSDYDYGFMYSPGYPYGYPPNADQDCDRVMFTAAGKLRVGFLQLRTRPEDTITVSSRDSSSILLSGKLDFTNEFPELLSDSSNIRISMNSDGSGTDAGYLVAYAGALDGGSTPPWRSTEDYYATSGTSWWWASQPTALTSASSARSTEEPYYYTSSGTWLWDGTTEGYPHACELRRDAGTDVIPDVGDITAVQKQKGEKRKTPAAGAARKPSSTKKITKKRSKAISPNDKPALVSADIIHISLTEDTVHVVSSNTRKWEASRLVETVAGRKFGFIKSPNHPEVYPNNANIMFNVTTSDDSRVALRFLRLDLEREFDTVKVSEPGQPDLYVDCLFRDVIYSAGPEIYITFRSDPDTTRSGFLLAYASVEP